MEDKLYFCDPNKNTKCKKTNCAYLFDNGECLMTTHKEYAKDIDGANENVS